MKKFTFCLMMVAFFYANITVFATRYSVDVRDFEFSPSNLPAVRVGDTIHWEWKNGMHTTTSSTIPAGAAAWDQLIDNTHLSYDYIPTVVGTYNYVCTPHISLGMIGSFTVISASGIENAAFATSVSVFPNPFADRISFRVMDTYDSWVTGLKVIDNTGKILREYFFADKHSGAERTLDLSGLPSGGLSLVFTDNSGRRFSRNVIHK